jgi:antitoxin ParD1/3/4
MAVQLPADLETRIHEKVERGDYSDASEVVREAMRLLDARDHQRASLRAKLQSGLDQLDRGDGVPFTPGLMAEIRQQVQDRYQRGDRPKADVLP